MARPQKSRKVFNPPIMKGYKPFGMPMCEIEHLKLTFEEYESIKLVNYDNLSQEEAAEKMNVSRPTLTRIYNKALIIIAKAFVEGKAIDITGGNYEFDKDWFRCRKCHKLIEGLENHIKCENCTEFNMNELIPMNK
jgi:predicted DNA-binding protein (UPF0251 family)